MVELDWVLVCLLVTDGVEVLAALLETGRHVLGVRAGWRARAGRCARSSRVGRDCRRVGNGLHDVRVAPSGRVAPFGLVACLCSGLIAACAIVRLVVVFASWPVDALEPRLCVFAWVAAVAVVGGRCRDAPFPIPSELAITVPASATTTITPTVSSANARRSRPLPPLTPSLGTSLR